MGRQPARNINIFFFLQKDLYDPLTNAIQEYNLLENIICILYKCDFFLLFTGAERCNHSFTRMFGTEYNNIITIFKTRTYRHRGFYIIRRVHTVNVQSCSTQCHCALYHYYTCLLFSGDSFLLPSPHIVAAICAEYPCNRLCYNIFYRFY